MKALLDTQRVILPINHFLYLVDTLQKLQQRCCPMNRIMKVVHKNRWRLIYSNMSKPLSLTLLNVIANAILIGKSSSRWFEAKGRVLWK